MKKEARVPDCGDVTRERAWSEPSCTPHCETRAFLRVLNDPEKEQRRCYLIFTCSASCVYSSDTLGRKETERYGVYLGDVLLVGLFSQSVRVITGKMCGFLKLL